MLDLNSRRLTNWACYRGNHPKIFHEIDAFKNFTKFTGKHLYQSLEFCEIFKNTFFYRISTVAASVATPNLVNSKSNFVLIFEHQCLFFDLVVLLLLQLLLLFYFGRNKRCTLLPFWLFLNQFLVNIYLCEYLRIGRWYIFWIISCRITLIGTSKITCTVIISKHFKVALPQLTMIL